jgi:tRNA 2-thiouridine synthesizing protein A
MKAGEVLVVDTTDPLARLDIPAFCNEDGHRLLGMEPIEGGHSFRIEKG